MKTETLVLLVCIACGNSEPANEGKRMPAPPPVVKQGIPANVAIEVIVDGKPRPPITQATLLATPPDWSDPQRKAWKIARLVGAPETPETSFAVTGTAQQITVELPAVSAANPLVPALMLSQRGIVVAEFVDPKNPFPSFHGEGGRLGRSPESEPRVPGVTRIEVRKRTP
jgi:hypothetical protein